MRTRGLPPLHVLHSYCCPCTNSASSYIDLSCRHLRSWLPGMITAAGAHILPSCIQYGCCSVTANVPCKQLCQTLLDAMHPPFCSLCWLRSHRCKHAYTAASLPGGLVDGVQVLLDNDEQLAVAGNLLAGAVRLAHSAPVQAVQLLLHLGKALQPAVVQEC